jgi:hypothetical protein
MSYNTAETLDPRVWGRTDDGSTEPRSTVPVRIIPFSATEDDRFNNIYESSTSGGTHVHGHIVGRATLDYLSKFLRDYERLKQLDLPPILTSDVSRFVVENELMDHLSFAKALAEELFTDVSELSFAMKEDPDTDVKWIVLNVVLADDSNFFDDYRAYNRQFVQGVPWPERSLIRFDCTFQ